MYCIYSLTIQAALKSTWLLYDWLTDYNNTGKDLWLTQAKLIEKKYILYTSFFVNNYVAFASGSLLWNTI